MAKSFLLFPISKNKHILSQDITAFVIKKFTRQKHRYHEISKFKRIHVRTAKSYSRLKIKALFRLIIRHICQCLKIEILESFRKLRISILFFLQKTSLLDVTWPVNFPASPRFTFDFSVWQEKPLTS